MLGTVVVLPIFLQNGTGLSALITGMAVLSGGIIAVLTLVATFTIPSNPALHKPLEEVAARSADGAEPVPAIACHEHYPLLLRCFFSRIRSRASTAPSTAWRWAGVGFPVTCSA